MGTRAVCASSTDARLVYLGTRLPARMSVPLVTFLGTAGLTAGSRLTPGDLLLTVALAGGLLLQFRLWDDLADLPHDRGCHPDRVLSRARRLAPFRSLMALSAGLNAVLIALRAGSGPRLLAGGLLGGSLGLWYGALRRAWANPIVGYHVILAKYPVFVYLLSAPAVDVQSGFPHRLVLAMGLVYLCFCVHEALHDPDLGRAPGVRAVLAVEMVALVALSTRMSVTLAGRGLLVGLLHAAGALAGAGVLAGLFARHRAGPVAGRGRYAVFVFGFLELLTLSLEGRV